MKAIFTLCLFSFMLSATAQTDTTATAKTPGDTIRIGGLIIIRRPGTNREIIRDSNYVAAKKKYNPKNITTDWLMLDMGFSNYNDESNYVNAAISGFVAPGIDEQDLELRAGKSRNVNIWFFMQRLNIISHVLNLKYGLGLELNNYSFDNTSLQFSKNPTRIFESATNFKKVKLAADYLTLPVMLNINFTPNNRKGFGIGGGVSAGYLYSARVKSKDDGDVSKIKNDFSLEHFKISYIAEISLGPVRLYGSYAMKNMWERGLDMTPYNFGFRFGNL